MSFPKHNNLKPSGVKWIGLLPEHWSVVPVRLVAQLESGHTPSRSKPEYWENCTVPWFTLGDVWQLREGSTKHIKKTKEKVSELGLAHSAARILPKGTVILSRTASVGFSAIMGVPMATTQDFANWICGTKLSPEFLLYALRAMGSEFERLRMGSTHNTIYMPDIRSLRTALPPLQEQADIVSFLDLETAKIDVLVAEQRRLIELLKEKRQAVISHAVTKGLNPDAPMKASGVPWLGDVPAHWAVKRLKFLCDLQTGGRDTVDAESDGQYPFFVRSQNVERIGSMSFDCEAVLTAGDGAGVGKVFHYHVGPFDFHQRVYMMNNFRGISGRLFFQFLRANFYKVALEGGAKSTVDSLRRPMLTNFAMCVPPESEQYEIVEFVDKTAQRYDVLAQASEDAIELLQERRTSLVSAAVTGKIDVREFAYRETA